MSDPFTIPALNGFGWILPFRLVLTGGNLFAHLEIHHELSVDNINHLWLLHFLFLKELNHELDLFKATWNDHLLNRPGEQARSPRDLFTWDVQVCGLRGDLLPEGKIVPFFFLNRCQRSKLVLNISQMWQELRATELERRNVKYMALIGRHFVSQR